MRLARHDMATDTAHYAQYRPSPHSGAADTSSQGRETAFAGALRHSRRVRLFKILLPALAILLASAFAIYSYVLSPAGISVDFVGSGISDGKLVMANPTMNGYTKENLPYSMRAKRAIQDLSLTGAIKLEGIDAKVPLSSDTWAVISADGGLYDDAGQTLDIDTPATFTTSDGLTAKFKSAFIDMEAGELKTSDPVEIVQGGSRITSDKFQVLERGDVFLFEDRVRMKIEPREAKSEKTADGAGKSGN